MKRTLRLAKRITLSAILIGTLVVAFNPAAGLAQHRGGGGQGSSGGRSSGGGRSFSGQRGFSGGQGYSGQRGYSGRQNFSGQRGYSGGQALSGGGSFSGGERGFSGRRDDDRGRRGGFGYGNRYYRGGYLFGFYGAPYGYSYYPGYNSYGYCNPNGYYDRWGNWFPDPRCSNDPYGYGY